MSQFPRYESYKDSGVQWLGEIPSHWKCLSIKRLTLVKRGASPRPIDNPEYFDDEGEYAWVRIADVTASDKYLLETTQRLSELGSSLSVKMQPGSIFLSIAGSVGKPIITKVKACIHDGFVYFPDWKESINFLYYIFASGQPYLGLGKLGTQLNLNTDTVGNIKIALPPSDEQEAIVNFLDKRLAQVDELIAKQEELLKKLAEQRIALISHAVTKGLDPNVEMEDSGVEWLGEVPKHWVCMGLKKSLESIVDYRGKTPEKVESGIFLVTARNIKNGYIDYSLSQEYVEEEQYQKIMSRGLPEIGDVLLTTEAPLGEIAQIDNINIALAQRVIKFRGKKEILDNDFLKYFMLSRNFQDSLYTYSSGSTAIGIKAERLAYLRILIPPIEEQTLIKEFIDHGIYEIKNMSNKVEQALKVLKEYRSTLITQAVTGKIDVRNIDVN